MRRRARAAVLGLGILALLPASACRPRCAPPDATRPSVVLVTVDTLRADHLGCYGNRRVRTPHLDRLAAEGALFERCYAQAPITVPSHLTILTSLPPAVHGALDNAGRAAPGVETLPALFARAGYRTAAFVGAKFLGPGGRFGAAFADFQVYEGPRRASVPRRAEETNRRFVRWVEGACGEPFFAWLHYWEPHMPYAPPAPWDGAYYPGDPYAAHHAGMEGVALGWFLYDLEALRAPLARRAATVRSFKRELGLSTRGVRRLLIHPHELQAPPPRQAALRARLAALGAAVRPELPFRRHLAGWLAGVRDVEFPRARYAGEVSAVDEAIGALRAELERLELAPRTTLVVTGDHGESLGEHGIYFDHVGLHDPSLHVPLIVWAPGRVAAGRQVLPVRSLDVAPTILGLAGLAAPAVMQGRDLLATPPRPAPVVAQSARGTQAMWLAGSWKLIRTLESFSYTDAFGREAGQVELYDLAADPDERHDLAGRETARAHAMAAELDAWLVSTPRRGDGGRPPEELERQLRALGYVE